jgi:tetratricopeptide (TPR) repeat protein
MRRPRLPLVCAAVSGLAALPYLRALRFPFVFDDRYLVADNAFLREAWSPLRAFAHHFWHGTPFGPGYYRPVVVASLALNGRLLGWGPAGFHLVNVLLHAANAALLCALLRRSCRAASASALFALHPAAAWAVSSVVARVDLLPAFFVLLAWIAYEEGEPADGAPHLTPARSACLTGAFFLGALLCKESAAAFAIVPLLGARRRPRAAVATGAAVAAWALARVAAGAGLLGPRAIDPDTNPLAALSAARRVPAALALSARYLTYLLVPVRFADPMGYGPGSPAPSWFDPWAVAGVAILAAWIGATLRLTRAGSRVGPPLAFSLAAFLPASNLLVPIASLYAENFLYLPLLGLAVALGRLPATGRAVTVPAGAARPAGALLAIALAAGSLSASGIWRDEITLFGAFAARFPRYPLAHASLGAALLDRGQAQQAIGPLRRALALGAGGAVAHYNLGTALAHVARDPEPLEEALAETREAIRLAPELTPARVNAADLLLRLGRAPEAEAQAREALRRTPGHRPARVNLAAALLREGRARESAAEYRALAREDPADAALRSALVVALIDSGALEEARREAVAARRDFPDRPWFDFCLARVAARAGRRAEALALLENAAARAPALGTWVNQVHDFDALRGTPAFDALAAPGRSPRSDRPQAGKPSV